ncbi:ankyrin repeat domain-containing protein [Acerihabitans sp. KWT182]|uniref:Ankyrin repeat domain-containing protein n=1 Tax=Acerihabitans sp. KWT182 TaxID=3157919 RepID=A0AAU7QBU6_9GAMM
MSREKDGLAPVLLAAGYGNKMCLNSILSVGADINAVDNRGWSALMRAVACGNYVVVKFLVAKGANVNLRGADNATALTLALDRAHKPMVKILRDAGADADSQDIQSRLAKLLAPQTDKPLWEATPATQPPKNILQTSPVAPVSQTIASTPPAILKPIDSGVSSLEGHGLWVTFISSIPVMFRYALQYVSRGCVFE